jgi:hypothetical protein
MSNSCASANSKFIRTDVICNGTSICACSRCGGSLESYRKMAEQYLDIIYGKFVGDQFVIDREKTNWVKSLARTPNK